MRYNNVLEIWGTGGTFPFVPPLPRPVPTGTLACMGPAASFFANGRQAAGALSINDMLSHYSYAAWQGLGAGCWVVDGHKVPSIVDALGAFVPPPPSKRAQNRISDTRYCTISHARECQETQHAQGLGLCCVGEVTSQSSSVPPPSPPPSSPPQRCKELGLGQPWSGRRWIGTKRMLDLGGRGRANIGRKGS